MKQLQTKTTSTHGHLLRLPIWGVRNKNGLLLIIRAHGANTKKQNHLFIEKSTKHCSKPTCSTLLRIWDQCSPRRFGKWWTKSGLAARTSAARCRSSSRTIALALRCLVWRRIAPWLSGKHSRSFEANQWAAVLEWGLQHALRCAVWVAAFVCSVLASRPWLHFSWQPQLGGFTGPASSLGMSGSRFKPLKPPKSMQHLSLRNMCLVRCWSLACHLSKLRCCRRCHYPCCINNWGLLSLLQQSCPTNHMGLVNLKVNSML